MKQSLESSKIAKCKYVKLTSELTNDRSTLKSEVRRQKQNIQINKARLASKDDELIKFHSEIDKLSWSIGKLIKTSRWKG